MIGVLAASRAEAEAVSASGADLTGPETAVGSTTQFPPRSLDNAALADCLGEVAELLEARGANPFRVRSYRRAAQVVRELSKPVRDMLDREGTEALERLPGLGKSLVRSIERLARTGRLTLLDRLRTRTSASAALSSVAGIGRGTAERVQRQLGINTLADLEAAAIDGRLGHVPGMGRKRIRSVIECLSGRMRQVAPVPQPEPQEADAAPPVAELLDIDREYREKAAAGKLPQIAPRRFNPTGEAWLPILHTQRGCQKYTALFSNTARAHELGTTHDWVVIYLDDDTRRYQCTVITALFGRLRGHRIIRGREEECRHDCEQLKVQQRLPF